MISAKKIRKRVQPIGTPAPAASLVFRAGISPTGWDNSVDLYAAARQYSIVTSPTGWDKGVDEDGAGMPRRSRHEPNRLG